MLQKFVVWESVVQAYYVKGYQPASQTHNSDPFLFFSTLLEQLLANRKNKSLLHGSKRHSTQERAIASFSFCRNKFSHVCQVKLGHLAYLEILLYMQPFASQCFSISSRQLLFVLFVFVLFCLVFLPSNQQLLKFSQPSTLHVQAYRVCMVLFYFSAFHMLARSRHSACIRSLQRSCAFSHKLVLAVQVWTQEDVLVQENTQAHTSVY